MALGRERQTPSVAKLPVSGSGEVERARVLSALCSGHG